MNIFSTAALVAWGKLLLDAKQIWERNLMIATQLFGATGEQLEDIKKYLDVVSRKRPTEELWATPNTIIHEDDGHRVRLFYGDEHDVNQKGVILLGSPQAGHGPECVDIAPDRSLVRTLHVHSGLPVAVMGWKNTAHERRDKGMDEIVGAIKHAHRLLQTRFDKVYAAGVCAHGYPMVMTEALNPGMFRGILLSASPMDFTIDGGPIQEHIQRNGEQFYRDLVDLGDGVLDGKYLVMGFIMMSLEKRVEDDTRVLFGNIVTGKDTTVDKYIEFMNWYEKTQCIPGKLYRDDIVGDLFIRNKMIKNDFYVDDERVDLTKITCPIGVTYGSKDEITLPRQALAILDAVNTPDAHKRAVEAKGGHFHFASGGALNTYFPDVIRWLVSH